MSISRLATVTVVAGIVVIDVFFGCRSGRTPRRCTRARCRLRRHLVIAVGIIAEVVLRVREDLPEEGTCGGGALRLWHLWRVALVASLRV